MSANSANSSAKALYLPGLNGIRALAASAVLVAHLNDHLLLHEASSLPALNSGRFAVSMFFALSGFLITYLLMLEKEKTQTVSIPKFYMRRILRIWPLYFTYIAATLVFAWSTDSTVNLLALLLLGLFAANVNDVLAMSTPHTSHYWSLGVEEQFYLFWPWLIRLGKHVGKSILAFLIFFTLLKVGIRFGMGGFSTAYTFVFMTRFDCMAIGGLAAWLAYSGIPGNLKPILFNSLVQIFSWLSLIAVVADLLPVPTLVQHQVVAFLTAIIMLNLTQNPKPLISLEGKVWNFMGDISFGLYVWHPLLIALLGNFIFGLDLSMKAKLGLFIALAPALSVLTAYLSLRFLERPFLKLKDKFALIATKRHA